MLIILVAVFLAQANARVVDIATDIVNMAAIKDQLNYECKDVKEQTQFQNCGSSFSVSFPENKLVTVKYFRKVWRLSKTIKTTQQDNQLFMKSCFHLIM